ncbi:MAG: N-acetylmuramoyl-L-alanine amidase [Syntrophomonas sp.]|nr:N-acetylmuramoyl-L-alanine amidase [Syntrophomonas sp.]
MLTVAIYISSLLGSTVDKAAAQTGVVSGSVVNVRSGPSTGDVVIGSLYKDTRVNILAQAGEWYNIQFGQLSGWMHQSVLSAQSLPVTDTPVAVPVQSQTPTVTLDGTKMTFDVPPIIEKGRILVPMAAIFRSMGATVDWNQGTQTVTAVRGDTRVILPINSYSPTVNGTVWKLDVPARIVGNRTLAPLRFVGEALGGTVTWDAANFKAIMTSPPAAEGNSGQTAEDKPPVVAVTIGSSAVNLRSGPDTTYSVVDQAKPGETLTVLGKQGDWYLVNRGIRNAWAAGWVVELIREGEAIPPSGTIPETPPATTPETPDPIPPGSEPVMSLETVTISSQREAEGLRITIESAAKLDSKLSETSGQLTYVLADRQISDSATLEKWLGAQKVTVQGSQAGNDVLVNIKLPVGIEYQTKTENSGKREVLFIPNYISAMSRSTFGSSGENITVKGIAALGYTTDISSSRVEILFKNATVGMAKSSYNFDSPLIKSLTFKPSGDNATVMTLETTKPAKFSIGSNDDGSVVNIIFIDQREMDSREPLVVLDAGHGGSDPGACGNNLREKDVNLAVALKAGQLLEQKGIRVAYTRQDDTFVELNDRPQIANLYNAAVFVSVHSNSSTSPSPSGTETYSYYPLGRPDLYVQKDERYNLALMLQQELIAKLGRNDRGVKQANFAVLRNTDMPSALVEMAFISNPTEGPLLGQSQFQRSAAEAIADAIENYMQTYVD